jgi:hypothetical protein
LVNGAVSPYIATLSMPTTRLRTAGLAAALLAGAAAPAMAAGVAGLFSQGRSHFVITGGSATAFDQSYFVLGIGGSYNLFDGFNVGLHVARWTGEDPAITQITPSVQYVFHRVPGVSPYLGAFYRRAIIDDLPDLDSTGVRAGVYLGAGRSAYLGAGLVQETYRDCRESVYRDCSDTYPEFSFTFVF